MYFPVKYSICRLFTGKCNFVVVPGWGICALFLAPLWVFAAFPKWLMPDSNPGIDGHTRNWLSLNTTLTYPSIFYVVPLRPQHYASPFSRMQCSMWTFKLAQNFWVLSARLYLRFRQNWRWVIGCVAGVQIRRFAFLFLSFTFLFYYKRAWSSITI